MPSTEDAKEFARKPKACEGCPAYEAGKSYVPGVGPTTARIALIGQGPGPTEADGIWDSDLKRKVRAPFIGRAGQELNSWLHQAKLTRNNLYIDNVVRCWLRRGKKDREPTAKERAYCTEHHLHPSLANLKHLQIVVPIGVPAIRWLYGDKANGQWAGSLRRVEVEW